MSARSRWTKRTAGGLPVSRVHAALPAAGLGRARRDGDLGGGRRDDDRVIAHARPAGGGDRDHQPARDGRRVGPAHAASRCIARSCGRTGGRPSGARRSRPKAPAAGPRSNRPRARSVLLGTKLEWLLPKAASRPAPHLAFGTVDCVAGVEPDRRRRCTPPSRRTRAARCCSTSGDSTWSDELLRPVSASRPRAARGASVERPPRRHAPVCGLPAGIPIAGVAGDQQAALFGQACFEPGMTKNTYGTGSFVLMNVGDRCPAPVGGLLTTVAWTLPDRRRRDRLRARGRDLRHRRGHPVAARRPRDHRRGGRGRAAGRDAVPTPRASTSCPRSPGSAARGGTRTRGARSSASRGARAGPTSLEPWSRRWPSRRETSSRRCRAHSGHPVTALRADGGASVMNLLLQLQADQLQAPVARPRIQETTALGAAYLAGLAEGVWSSLDEITANWVLDVELSPTSPAADVDAADAQWRRAVERSRDWARER